MSWLSSHLPLCSLDQLFFVGKPFPYGWAARLTVTHYDHQAKDVQGRALLAQVHCWKETIPTVLALHLCSALNKMLCWAFVADSHPDHRRQLISLDLCLSTYLKKLTGKRWDALFLSSPLSLLLQAASHAHSPCGPRSTVQKSRVEDKTDASHPEAGRGQDDEKAVWVLWTEGQEGRKVSILTLNTSNWLQRSYFSITWMLRCQEESNRDSEL